MPDMAAGMFMRNRDSLHSGNEIICSIQSQARYNLRTAVDAKTEHYPSFREIAEE